MEQLIWLAVNLHRNRHNPSDEERSEECFIDTIDNEVFKRTYYDSAHKRVDIYVDAKNYELGTYNTFKLASKLRRAKEDSIVRLRYNREDAKDIASVIYNCFDLNLCELPEDLNALTKNDLYDELVTRCNQDERIQSELTSKSERLIELLKLNNPVLSDVDLTKTKVWDFKLEQFPSQPAKKTSSSKLFSVGNIIALGLAVLFVYLIVKYGLASK